MKNCFDQIFEIMTKENNAAVLILLTDANFKNLFDDNIRLHNFKFQKEKIVLFLTKEFFSGSFHSCKLFHEMVSWAKNGT